MPAIEFVTPEEHGVLKREVAELRALIAAYVQSQDEWLDTEQAQRVTGIKARSTLVQHARATAPGVVQEGRITYRKEGVKCLYSRNSCISYRQRRHGQPALAG